MANSGYYTEPKLNATGGSSLTIREADGTPSGVVTELVFPNTSVSIAGGVGTLSLVVPGDLATIATTGSFTDLDDRPSTLSGYGITDAQPLDSDLTAIADLSTTSYGRSFLTQADAAAGRALLELGSANSPTFAGVDATGNVRSGTGSFTRTDSTTGLSCVSSASLALVLAGTQLAGSGNANEFTVRQGAFFGFSSNVSSVSASPDTGFRRDASGILAQRNGTNAQISRIYKTFTSTTNFETFEIDAASDASNYRIGSRIGSAGGTTRGLQIGSYNAAGIWTSWLGIDTSGNVNIASVPSNGGLTLTPTSTFNAFHGLRLCSTSAGAERAVFLIQPTSGEIMIGANNGGGYYPVIYSNGVPRLTINTSGATTINGSLTHVPPSSITPSTNGQFSIEMTSDTAGNLVYRGSDGTTRRMALTFS